MLQPIETLNDFYAVMQSTRAARLGIIENLLKEQSVNEGQVKPLHQALAQLESIPRDQDQYLLKLDKDKQISLDLTYEIEELKKDIFFLEHDENNFIEYLARQSPHFYAERDQIISTLSNINFHCFITDRDGTVNNYCGRYASSIQSVYNAVFLCRFARQKVKHAVILTSAPLKDIGLIDISLCPADYFIYAASKGREYVDQHNIEHRFPIDPDQQKMINILNERLSQLIKKPAYEKFSLIGSGLQYKFGQTTIARQDISGSVPEKESENLLRYIQNLVNEIDPDHKYFQIEDTGKDIEIILTIDQEGKNQGLKDFDKGDAIDFLDRDIPLNLARGPTLICGDTSSDIPMAKAAQKKSPQTRVVFVTQDQELRQKVTTVSENALFVSYPDVLVVALNELSRTGK